MLVNSIEILKKAKEKGIAIPQFNINNLEWTKYILEQCQLENTPVILGVSEGAIKYMGGYQTVCNIVNGLIDDLKISIPVVIHLDHGSSIESCKRAIDAGFSSVMIDLSSKNLIENIIGTKEVVRYAHQNNVSVEGEIGSIGGKEDAVNGGIAYASLEESINYVNESELDSFAPAIGTVHGFYHDKPNLNYELAKEMNEKIDAPLVLHGGSGLSKEEIINCIKSGIAKININTELQVVWSKAVREFIIKNEDVYDPRKIISSGEKAIKEEISHKIEIFQKIDC